MPGGQSASVFGASFEVLDRSTGISGSVTGALVATAAGSGELGISGLISVTGLKLGRSIFSMEKERFLETAGALLRVSAACSTSVGVGGGEERRLEFRDGAGEDLKLKDDDEEDDIDDVGEKMGG